MANEVGKTDRRAFLKSGLAGALLATGACGRGALTDSSSPPATGKSRIVVARDEKLRTSRWGLDSARLLKLLDNAMQALYVVDSPGEAWKRVVRPQEVVGLKVNCLAGYGNSTRMELVEAVCERLREAGIREIVIWDRLSSDLEAARYRVVERGQGIRCFGNDFAGYEEELSTYGRVSSLLSKTLTRISDAVINLPVLKDHSITGVTIALKNVFGAIHNPNKYHLSAGDPYIADAYMLAPIRQKVRLTICDATTAQYEGGPSFMPQWMWLLNSLLLGTDPVALDYTGWQIIERKRAEVGMKPLKELRREPTYIATAADAEHRLGTNDPERIEVVHP